VTVTAGARVDGQPIADDTARGRAQWILLAGKFLSGLAFFATAPFLVLYLTVGGAVSLPVAGAVVGSVALVAAVGATPAGVLADRVGAVRAMRWGVEGNAVLYLLLALVHGVDAAIVLIVLLGVPRTFLEPSMKKLLSAAAGAEGGQVFRRRYVVICSSAIVGPLAGAGLYVLGQPWFFLVPMLLFIAYLGVILTQQRVLGDFDRTGSAERPHWRSVVTDQRLLLIVLGGTLVFLVFSQFESMIPVVIRAARPRDGATVFSWLLAGDAALGIALQQPIVALAKRVSTRTLNAIGAIGFAFAFTAFTAAPGDLAVLALGTVAFALGEALLYPVGDMLLHNASTPTTRGTYFGAGELRYVGFFLGPVLGGALLEIGRTVYLVAALVITALGAAVLARLCREEPSS
jgi:MFS family permease